MNKRIFWQKKKHLVFWALLFWSDYKQVDDAFSVAILNDASTGVIIIIFLRSRRYVINLLKREKKKNKDLGSWYYHKPVHICIFERLISVWPLILHARPFFTLYFLLIFFFNLILKHQVCFLFSILPFNILLILNWASSFVFICFFFLSRSQTNTLAFGSCLILWASILVFI